MAHRKAGGSAKNFTDSNPQYLGVKLYDGQVAKKGNIIVRQRGSKFRPGQNAALGKDDTIFALADGKIKFGKKNITSFSGKKKVVTTVSVVA